MSRVDFNEVWVNFEVNTHWLFGHSALSVAGFLILICYCIIMALCFIWQRFDIVVFMLVIFITIGMMILFWYIAFGIEDPSRLGWDALNSNWDMSWAFNWIYDIDETLKNSLWGDVEDWWEEVWGIESVEDAARNSMNFNPLRDMLKILIALIQWFFNVGLLLIVMCLVTYAFSSMFKIDFAVKLEQLRNAISEMASEG